MVRWGPVEYHHVEASPPVELDNGELESASVSIASVEAFEMAFHPDPWDATDDVPDVPEETWLRDKRPQTLP